MGSKEKALGNLEYAGPFQWASIKLKGAKALTFLQLK